MDCWDIHNWVATIICIVGLIGNGIAFCTFGKMCNRNASIYLFRALAVVDYFYLALYYSLRLANNLRSINTDNFWVDFVIFFLLSPLLCIAHTSAIWTILLVGFHRYIVVCQPLRAARLCTIGNARRHFLCVLLLSFIVNFPILFAYEVKEATSNHTNQNVTYKLVQTTMGRSAWYDIGYQVVFHLVILDYAIPVGSLIFITARLLQSLRSSRRGRMELSESQRRGQTSYITEWVVILVLIMFLLCHTGMAVHIVLMSFNMLQDHGNTICKSTWFILYALGNNMISLNSSINIFIYLGFNRNFRNTLCPCVKSATSRQNRQPETLTRWILSSDLRLQGVWCVDYRKGKVLVFVSDLYDSSRGLLILLFAVFAMYRCCYKGTHRHQNVQPILCLWLSIIWARSRSAPSQWEMMYFVMTQA